uniref:NADH-ubiquinone oxidoreductase chain 2 n=1 Tax=Leptodius sanguineus TaxID=903667 RepID=A0A140GMD2_9EUCA|nr:NADH dehydrogenase subunit 2 [Leptodius sanguineus]AMN14568.1 NADH dehydrogenase subunit 2 [Leptodius sanguineus]
MVFPVSSMFFLFSLFLGSLLSISSSSWFGAWIGLELNLLSFIPLIAIKMNPYTSEAALKYFLTQALASTLIIMSSCLFLFTPNLSSPLILMALLLKLGAAPFHLWFPQVMEGLMWPQAVLLLSIQKLAPMILISYLLISPTTTQIIILSAILSAVVGGLGGLNTTKLRKIMAFSSINHMAWLLTAICINDTAWTMYFLFYVSISTSVIIFFFFFQATTISDLLASNRLTLFSTLMIPLSLLSLGGLPPLTGFIPKWLMIQFMLSTNMIIPLFFLLSSTLVTLYFYLRITIPFILFLSPSLSFNIKLLPKHTPLLLLFTLFNFLGLMIPLPFTLF